MRAVLVINPNATSTTAPGRDLLAHALESRLDLQVIHTTHRGHAVEISQSAAATGTDLIIVHGGDGTVHSVVNGLLGPPGGRTPGRLPAVAVVPGGSANVFARSLGIDPDPVVATNQLIALIGARVTRRIGVIDCGERWSVLNAGIGVDGEVVAAVEAQRERGRNVTPLRYIWASVPAVVSSTRRPAALTVRLNGGDPVPGVHFVFVSNCSPWTYANSRPVWTNPGTTFESGFGVFATRNLTVVPALRIARQMFSKQPKLHAEQLIRHDDAEQLHVEVTGEPIAAQIDGEYLGRRSSMTFRAHQDALTVVAPPPSGGSARTEHSRFTA